MQTTDTTSSRHKPNYETLRGETPFSWYVGSGHYALLSLVTDISLYDINMDPKAMIDLYRRGMPKFENIFDHRVARPGYTTPPISYAHINGLGVDLVFPKFGEVNYERTGWSLEELIGVLKSPVNWSEQGKIPFYIDYQHQMQEAFPDKRVALGLGYEGPMTTAYELLDSAVFTSPYDDPEQFKYFLELMTASIVDFARFRKSLEDKPQIDASGMGMCDDVASMFAPEMWDEFVIPYMHQFYEGLTTGARTAHIEDLRPEHLHYLEALGLVRFDPSISAKISPIDLRERCRVPFGWRMGNFHYATLDEKDVHDWVFKAAADGASYVFTHVSNRMLDSATIAKVYAFMEAATSVESMMESGATRADLLAEVSPEGKERFWRTWPD